MGIERAAGESRKYGKHTAVKSWLANQKGPGIFAKSPLLDPKEYPDDESRCELLNKIYKSWNAAPICASVAIKTWQMYFDALCGHADDVAQCILDWMPCMCDVEDVVLSWLGPKQHTRRMASGSS